MSIIKDELPRCIDEILAAYDITGGLTDWTMIHNGHINRTYEIEYTNKDGKKAKNILQQINTHVFTKPVELMENVVRVTNFLRDKIADEGGDPERETLRVFPTKTGGFYFVDSDDCFWRVYNFVDDVFCYNSIESDELFFRAGEAFGKFQSQLADFPVDMLHETIVDFHDTYKRLQNLKAAEKNNASGRADTVAKELRFAYDREADTSVIVDALKDGSIPVRVTHNDTKLNNIMFDAESNTPVCVIDLDTIMPGSSLYDFGDAIRYGANTAAEDEKDLSKVSLDLNLYKQYVKGYLKYAGKSLVEKEIELLPFAAKLLTFECGIRFLADYIDGDVYFNTDYPEHNLDRCHTQFALVADIEKKLDEMKKITQDAYNEI